MLCFVKSRKSVSLRKKYYIQVLQVGGLRDFNSAYEMIYYFSGTGNSLHVANELARRLDDKVRAMVRPVSTVDEEIGLVFPVYAWGIPNVVQTFVRNQLAMLAPNKCYLYTVMTCGDDVGYADRTLELCLKGRLDAAFSVQMPNTYVCLPGFDVDAPHVSAEKMSRLPQTLDAIAADVRERACVRRLVRGGMPWVKTYILRPLFNHILLTDRYLHSDASRCSSCGRCVKVCPVGNIDITSGKPRWKTRCTGCLGCYHACPQHAIHFGCMTQNKGQKQL